MQLRAAFDLEEQAEDMNIDVSLKDLKRAPNRGLDIRFNTRRRALASLLKIRYKLIDAIAYKWVATSIVWEPNLFAVGIASVAKRSLACLDCQTSEPRRPAWR